MRSLKLKDEVKHIDIYEATASLRKIHYCGDLDTVTAVLKRYFELAKEAVLDGGEWDFNDAFQLCIHKKKVRIRSTKNINLRRPGETNTIVAYGRHIRIRRYRFVPSEQMRAELDYILENTNKEYRYAPIA